MSFSNSRENCPPLQDGIKRVLESLGNCSGITERLAEKSLSPDFQKGLDVLSFMQREIEGISPEPIPGRTFNR